MACGVVCDPARKMLPQNMKPSLYEILLYSEITLTLIVDSRYFEKFLTLANCKNST